MTAMTPIDRTRALRRFALTDALFRGLTRACAIGVLLMLGAIMLSLIEGSWLALSTFGFSLRRPPRTGTR